MFVFYLSGFFLIIKNNIYNHNKEKYRNHRSSFTLKKSKSVLHFFPRLLLLFFLLNTFKRNIYFFKEFKKMDFI